jgi:hypothetical protein
MPGRSVGVTRPHRKENAVRLTVPDVAPLVRALYERHAAGCCLHIVLDDLNVSDDDVRFCIEFARSEDATHDRPEDRDACVALGEKLLSMSRTQRLKLGRLAGICGCERWG